MPKPKSKDWKAKTFSLEVDVANKIKSLSKFEKMTQSEFIEFLVLNWDSSISPENKLNQLLNKRKGVVAEINIIENKIKETSDQITLFSEWKKQKALKRTEALQVLERMIVNKEFEDAERVSRTWQRITGIPALELIMEANENVKKKGI